ncbi:MAG: hypothetical protein WCQ54_08305 [Clostridiaceae bacterium]
MIAGKIYQLCYDPCWTDFLTYKNMIISKKLEDDKNIFQYVKINLSEILISG